MAVPAFLVKAAAVAGKKLATDAFTDPEKILKYIVYVFAGFVALISIIFGPFLLLTNIPSVLLNGETNNPKFKALFDNNIKLVATYNNAAAYIDNWVKDWIDEKKRTENYDKLVTHISLEVEWQALIAIDAVRYKQEFTNVSEKDVNRLAEKFIVKRQTKSQYTVTQSYTEIVDGKPVRKTRRVKRTRLDLYVSTKSFDEMIKELGFDEKEKSLAENMYNIVKSINFEEQLNIYDPGTDLDSLKEYPPGSAKIPYYSQADKRWALEPYGISGTIKSSGCGPTSLAMVVAGLTKNSAINPSVVAKWSYENGYRCEGSGSYWSLMTDGGKHYGLKVTPVSRIDLNSIKEALSNGNPVIACMGPGHFTRGGHFIVLRGITNGGKILVHDSASVNRSNVEWDLKIIASESSTAGGALGSPFWIFEP